MCVSRLPTCYPSNKTTRKKNLNKRGHKLSYKSKCIIIPHGIAIIIIIVIIMETSFVVVVVLPLFWVTKITAHHTAYRNNSHKYFQIQVRINERTVYLPLKYFVFYYSMNINTNGRPAPAAAATTKKTNVRLLCVTGRRFRSTNLIPSPRAQKQNMNNVLMVNNDLNNLYSFRCLFTKRWKKKFPRPRLKMKDTHFSI